MKTLLLLFLIPFACAGQTDVSNWLRARSKDSTSIYYNKVVFAPDTPLADRNPNDFYGDSITPPSTFGWKVLPNKLIGGYPIGKTYTGSEPKEITLEEKLLLYAEECWKDSTEMRGVHIKINGWQGCETAWSYGKGIMEEVCITRSHYTTKYIHREPTFIGFLEYLKKK